MTPLEYAEILVVPTVAEFRDHRMDRRRAFLACVFTYHLSDYLKKSGEDVEVSMKVFNGRCFEIVRGVCNGTKHFGWHARNSGNIEFRPGDEVVRPPCLAGMAVVGLSRLGDAHGGIQIGAGGLDLYDCVKTVLKTYQIWFPHLLADAQFDLC